MRSEAALACVAKKSHRDMNPLASRRGALCDMPPALKVVGAFDFRVDVQVSRRRLVMPTAQILILGPAASLLLATSGAAGADLPVKAKPIEYVKICTPYGPGFFFIPGTDTCMKIGGYLRVDTTFNGGIQGTPAWNGDAGQHNRYFYYFASRARRLLSIDTLTATEYGRGRTFRSVRVHFSKLGKQPFHPNSV